MRCGSPRAPLMNWYSGLRAASPGNITGPTLPPFFRSIQVHVDKAPRTIGVGPMTEVAVHRQDCANWQTARRTESPSTCRIATRISGTCSTPRMARVKSKITVARGENYADGWRIGASARTTHGLTRPAPASICKCSRCRDAPASRQDLQSAPMMDWFRPQRYVLTLSLLATQAGIVAMGWLGWELLHREYQPENQRARQRFPEMNSASLSRWGGLIVRPLQLSRGHTIVRLFATDSR
jgi:hypothetical protein